MPNLCCHPERPLFSLRPAAFEQSSTCIICHPERIPQLNGVVGRQKAVAITALLAHNRVARDLLFAFFRKYRKLFA